MDKPKMSGYLVIFWKAAAPSTTIRFQDINGHVEDAEMRCLVILYEDHREHINMDDIHQYHVYNNTPEEAQAYMQWAEEEMRRHEIEHIEAHANRERRN